MNHEPIRRASYALPEGVPALQQDPGLTRRTVLASLFIAVAAASAGLATGFELAGPAAVAQVVQRADPAALLLAWAEALAQAPDDELLRDRDRFLNVVESGVPTARLWDGVHRLVEQAPSQDPELLERLRSLMAERPEAR